MLGALRRACRPATSSSCTPAATTRPASTPRPSSGIAIAEARREAGALPLLDFAYQGFGDGLDEDARGLVGACSSEGRTLLVASSFSKNFALYDERVGALSIVGADAAETATLLSHAKAVVRANYSNPPAHGGEIVATILADDALRARWSDEVAAMRERINGNRRSVRGRPRRRPAPPATTRACCASAACSRCCRSATERVARLRDEFAIYVVGSGPHQRGRPDGGEPGPGLPGHRRGGFGGSSRSPREGPVAPVVLVTDAHRSKVRGG